MRRRTIARKKHRWMRANPAERRRFVPGRARGGPAAEVTHRPADTLIKPYFRPQARRTTPTLPPRMGNRPQAPKRPLLLHPRKKGRVACAVRAERRRAKAKGQTIDETSWTWSTVAVAAPTSRIRELEHVDQARDRDDRRRRSELGPGPQIRELEDAARGLEEAPDDGSGRGEFENVAGDRRRGHGRRPTCGMSWGRPLPGIYFRFIEWSG